MWNKLTVGGGLITDRLQSSRAEPSPYLVVLRCRLQVVDEQLLVLWQQGEHHCQPIEDQQEAFGQRSLVCKPNTRRGLDKSNMLCWCLLTAFYTINAH